MLDNGRFVCTVTVEPVEYPIVMAKAGDWKGMNSRTERPRFVEGDVWTRHSSKTERIQYEDLRSWIELAKRSEREAVLQRINKVIDVPDGAEIQIVPPSFSPIDSPKRLLQVELLRHQRDPSSLLGMQDLLHLFLNRQFLDLTQSELALVIASALRRNSTLYWWLTNREARPDVVMGAVESCLDSSDRDKSDAGKSIVEMITVFGTDESARRVVDALSSSRYMHFRTAAQGWIDRSTNYAEIRRRISAAKHGGTLLTSRSVDELEHLASELALQLANHGNTPVSRKLSDVTRVIWSKRQPSLELT